MIGDIEILLRRAAGIAMLVTLAVVLLGLSRGARQPPGRTVGRMQGFLRSQAFLVILSILYFGLCTLIWRPLPLALSEPARLAFALVAVLTLFPGLGFVLWGRFTLGRWYRASSSLGAQTIAGQALVTTGPYALLRHPMYLGYILTGLGGVLLFRNWTMVFLFFTFLFLILRAGKEEQVLAAEFGERWQAYCRTTPRWIPRLAHQQKRKVLRN